MRKVETTDDVSALRHALAARVTSEWTLYEYGERIAGFSPEMLEFSARPGQVVLRAPDASRIWRVTGWEERGTELRLRVRGAFGRDGGTLSLSAGSDSPLDWGPDWFEEAVRRELERLFGAANVTTSRAGARVVGIVRDRRRKALIGALAPGLESFVDDCIAASLVLRDRAEKNSRESWDLWFITAPPTTRVFAERLAWMRSSSAIHIFELATTGLSRVRAFDQGDLADTTSAMWPRASLPANDLVERILALSPRLLRRERRPGDSVDRITLRGLEVARLRTGRLTTATFGVGRRRENLNEASWDRFRQLIDRVSKLRSCDSPNRFAPEYRLLPERWLASSLRARPRLLDPAIDARFVYEQVPAKRRESRDLIDMLTVTSAGRLVVIELKADDDRALPLQGLNYWTRVRWHHARGEIARRGYFPGVELDPRPPLLLLVAPLFRLHASVKIAVECFDSEVECTVIGLNSGWRREPRVIFRVP